LAAALAQISAVHGADLTGTLKRIDATGRIDIGVRDNSPPMSFRERSGKPVGYSVDLCGHVVSEVKKTLKRDDIAVAYVSVTAENRFAAIESGKIDILCGATTRTLSRAARIGFTQLTFVTGASILSRPEDRVVTISDLADRRIAVIENTTTLEVLRQEVKAWAVNAEIVAVDSATEGMDMLDAGEVSAYAADQVGLIGQIIERAETSRYFLSPEIFSFEPYALAIARGDPDFQLVADRALSRLNRSGEILLIYEKWFDKLGEKPPTALNVLYQLNATPE
jgi:ABC-type amino acid transport substrate-binding protein